MPTIVTSLFPPPLRGSELPEPIKKYLFTLQRLLQFWAIDTSAGPYAETLPPAGLNSATGQSNQNQQITLKKVSADVNVYTFSGTDFPEGPRTLVFQYDSFHVQSDGTNWWLLP